MNMGSLGECNFKCPNNFSPLLQAYSNCLAMHFNSYKLSVQVQATLATSLLLHAGMIINTCNSCKTSGYTKSLVFNGSDIGTVKQLLLFFQNHHKLSFKINKKLPPTLHA